MNLTTPKNKILSFMATLVIGGAIFAGTANTAQAGVEIKINLTTQRMNVSVDGSHYATYKVSSGRRGYTTPTGRYRIQRMTRMHYSRKYNNSPMPNSIFYHGGFAIHGTQSISRLGRVASHGCVRLHPSNARELYDLVRAEGRRGTKIRVFRSKARVKIRKRKIASKKRYSKTRRARTKVRFADQSKPFFIFGGLDLAN